MPFDHPEFDAHERVTFVTDGACGLRAINAIHRLRGGTSGGGVRFRSYASNRDAIADALRLSRAMTPKFVLAGLPLGGAKTVVIGDPATMKSRELLTALGRFVESLGGSYLCGPDVGTSSADMHVIAEATRHVAGRLEDTSSATATGVFNALRALNHFLFGTQSFEGRRVAVQGAGAVGAKLCEQLVGAGAHVLIADVDAAATQRIASSHSVEIVSPDGILTAAVDLVAPCALGGILSGESIPRLRARGVCGCANNQLATPIDANRLHDRGIVFVPDYVASAGGAITGVCEAGRITREQAAQKLAGIFDTTSKILEEARVRRVPTEVVAQDLARRWLA